jgi:hypothetical protein
MGLLSRHIWTTWAPHNSGIAYLVVATSETLVDPSLSRGKSTVVPFSPHICATIPQSTHYAVESLDLSNAFFYHYTMTVYLPEAVASPQLHAVPPRRSCTCGSRLHSQAPVWSRSVVLGHIRMRFCLGPRLWSTLIAVTRGN